MQHPNEQRNYYSLGAESTIRAILPRVSKVGRNQYGCITPARRPKDCSALKAPLEKGGENWGKIGGSFAQRSQRSNIPSGSYSVLVPLRRMSSHAHPRLIMYGMQSADASQPSIFTPLSFSAYSHFAHWEAYGRGSLQLHHPVSDSANPLTVCQVRYHAIVGSS